MAFRFPLAAVLMVREHAEEREERALKKIQLEISRVRREIEQLDAEIVAAQNAREQALQQSIPAFELQESLRRVKAATEKKQMLALQLETHTRELIAQLKIYQVAHRDREALTDMLEKQREMYDQEQARATQKQLDDLFMARRHRS
jgi:flagellar export protein FliJ